MKVTESIATTGIAIMALVLLCNGTFAGEHAEKDALAHAQSRVEAIFDEYRKKLPEYATAVYSAETTNYCLISMFSEKRCLDHARELWEEKIFSEESLRRELLAVYRDTIYSDLKLRESNGTIETPSMSPETSQAITEKIEALFQKHLWYGIGSQAVIISIDSLLTAAVVMPLVRDWSNRISSSQNKTIAADAVSVLIGIAAYKIADRYATKYLESKLQEEARIFLDQLQSNIMASMRSLPGLEGERHDM